MSRFFRNVHKRRPITPDVTLIISAYNEEDVIDEKIRNSLAIDYPHENLEIMVVSDASTDRTEEIARRYKDQGVLTIRIEGRVGKTSCLNIAVPMAKGQIVIFSDANSLYPGQSISRIVENFADESVGCVTGYTKYISKKGDTVVDSLSVYSLLEKFTKELETSLGSCVGADGAIFAIRKRLYEPLGEADINDFVIPLRIIARGYRIVIESEAFCFEETAKDPAREFSRQVRITNRTLRAIFSNRHLLNGKGMRLFYFELVSHKMFKFLVPFFMAAILLSNMFLTGRKWYYATSLLLQGCFYAFSTPWASKLRDSNIEKAASLCRTFVVVNLAILKGWITFLKGERFNVWKSAR